MNKAGERFDWNAAAIATLKDLWQRGFSASKIEYQLGYPCTRAAVLGKLNRLGLLGRTNRAPMAPVRSSPKPTPRPRRNSGAAVAAIKAAANRRVVNDAIEYAPVPDSDADRQIPVAQRVTLFDLTADHCRWPVGQPAEPDFFFCGAPPLPGHTYCGPHCARAFNSQPRRQMNLSDAERQRRSAQSRVNQRNRQQPQFGI